MTVKVQQDSSFKPIFVVGASRSGTTLMGRILGTHEDVFTFHELHFFEQLWCSGDSLQPLDEAEALALTMRLFSIQRDGFFNQGEGLEYREEAYRIIGENVDLFSSECFRIFLDYESGKAGKNRPCDQTPRNIFYIDEILSGYPNAHFVVMVRDPRDVLISQKKKYLRRTLGANTIPTKEAVRSFVNYHPFTMSKLWNSAMVKALQAETLPNVHMVIFEKLLTEPERVIQELSRQLGLEYSESMLAVPVVGSSHAHDKKEVGINSKAIGQWKDSDGLSSTEIAICEWVNRDVMTALGFEQSGKKVDYLKLVLWAAYFPIHIAASLLFNLKRCRNLFETIKKRLGC